MLFILMFIIWAGPFERVTISMTCCVIPYFIISVIQLQWKIFRKMMIISLITFVHRKFHDRIIMNFITAFHFNILMPFLSILLYCTRFHVVTVNKFILSCHKFDISYHFYLNLSLELVFHIANCVFIYTCKVNYWLHRLLSYINFYLGQGLYILMRKLVHPNIVNFILQKRKELNLDWYKPCL